MRSIENGEFLVEKLSKRDFDSVVDSKNLFPNHLPFSEIHLKVQQKILHQGTFKASRDNFLEGYVNVAGFDDPVISVLFVCCFCFSIVLVC